MIEKIAVLCPTRDRFEMTKQVYQSWLDTHTKLSDFYIAIDNDQEEMYKDFPIDPAFVIVAPKGRKGMVDTTNFAALDLSGHYTSVMFVGTDHYFRTYGWDFIFYNVLMKDLKGTGFVYGNDLLQGERLPTECLISSDIIRTLGYMCPPCMQHLFVDDAWKTLGNSIGRIKYVSNVIIEHMHYSLGKNARDESYQQTDSLYAADKIAYNYWNDMYFDNWYSSQPLVDKSNRAKTDIAKLMQLVQQ